MPIRVRLGGVTGWTGRAVANAIIRSEDMTLVSAVSRNFAGQSLRKIDLDSDVTISPTVEEAFIKPTDVFVDYTSATSVRAHALTAIEKGIATIVGSSGLSAEDYESIHKLALAKDVGVIACGNFSITAALAKHFALLAANFLPSWEIIDYAGASKIDAPSGTTRELAESLESVRANKLNHPIADVVGDSTARGAQIKGTPVHSLRLHGFVLSFETIFGLPGERLSIRHDAGSSAEPYVEGTMLALRKVSKVKGLIRGLDTLMFEA